MSKTILGLDLGVTSIGWALIEVCEEKFPIRITAMGSRIIPLTTDEKTEFQRGQSISKNQNRTTNRTQRKGYDRKQDRKENLKKILENLDIFPSENLMKLPSLELWKLRSDAASSDKILTDEELGRVFYMMNQKRGYKSARSEANMDKKDTEYVADVKSRHAQLKESNQTIGQYFYGELLRAKENSEYFQVKKKVYPREAYIEEFDKIIEVQKEKHKFLTDDVVDEIRNKIIFYQRHLKSQKGLVSFCDFELVKKEVINENGKIITKILGPKIAPKSSPLNQLCKIWETVNNISLKIKNPEGSKYKWSDWTPTLENKIEIANYLNTHDSLTFSELLKIVNLKKEEVYTNKQILKGLQGNKTFSAIAKILGEKHPLLNFEIDIKPQEKQAFLVDRKTGEILEEHASYIVDENIEKEPLYRLWHTIYSIKDSEECKNALIKKFGHYIEEEKAEKLSKLDFTSSGYANKSHKAMRKILPYLLKGYNYSQACSLAGYNHSNSLTRVENSERFLKDKLKLLKKNELRQPVVEKILNQTIHIVNAIIEKYGRPAEIRVELARELKQSKDERNDADIQISKNNKLNQEIAKRLQELGLPSTKKNIQKYKFIFPVRDKKITEGKVFNQCIYCGKSFSLSDAMRGDNFDIDHIVPKALLFDDSQMNKVLVHRECNDNKGKLTAYDYIASKGEDELKKYLDRVDTWYNQNIISYGKMLRLKVSHKEYLERKSKNKQTEADKRLWENFIDRQLRESSYISRKATEILKNVCRNVSTTEGGVTAKLRKLWGWDNVLMNLNIEKYRKLGQTEIVEWTSNFGKEQHKEERIKNWTKRDDHRHHAIDALVVACTKQGYIQRLNTLNASDTRNKMLREISDAAVKYNERLTLLENYLIAQKPFTTRDVEEAASQILVSFKTGKKVATISKYKAQGKNKSIGVLTPRGALHEQFVYGKIKTIDSDKPLKFLFENVDLIKDEKIKTLIEARIAKYNGDGKKALASVKKSPIYVDIETKKTLDKADCYKDEYVIKYKIQDLKKKDLQFIVDDKIRAILSAKIGEHNGNEKEAFKETVWFNKEKGIPIKTVRCRTGLSAVQPVKQDGNGKNIGFAKTGNNHHIALYYDNEQNIHQHICSFWHAVERKKYKFPVIIKNSAELWNTVLEGAYPEDFLKQLPDNNLTLKFSLQQNEMFILGLEDEDFEYAIRNNDNELISEHLYLTWSIADNDYWFRHHLETKNSDLKKIEGAKESKRFYRLTSVGSFLKLNPKKVKVNHLGEIIKIGEN
ncbi:CRISPR-associated endonuclease Csn1 [Cruoricaptor ignavus]|uniref:CRISPR-associated endonuclease Cas9 n=1 Tax=Cruoricaptor ignavus TaxID=1118202 RepID=A0A1M6GJ07_9FLAO|nr:type II CRISPR RNA-guided endonuclease Cas9 [Cruoricaptor ignavus]SHJ09923.1 CRISPR-associated endonuclease Csn1 [Cruoricaptor ignavus]